MERAERAALQICAVGVGIAMIGVAGPLAFPEAPKIFWQIIVLIGALITVGAAALLIYEYRDLVRRKRMIPAIGMIVSGVLFVAFAGWYFWPGKGEKVAEASPLDGMIQISCDPADYPAVVPQNRMYELQLNNRFMAATEGGASISWTLPAGTPITTRDPHTSPNHGWRFRITNFGKIAVINAAITFNIEYRKGDEVLKKSSATILPVFSLAPGDFVDVYAMNYSTEAVAVVTIPPTAQGFEPGGKTQETFKLITPFLNGASIGPFTLPKSPPAPPPQAPTPPNKQGKK